MSYQNINQYVFNKFYLKPSSEIMDVSLASDENDYDKEVLFSPYIIFWTIGKSYKVLPRAETTVAKYVELLRDP